ncbi:hypothetical protein ACWCPF_20595 [Streptomyces sp. NPDC001858]
MQTAGLVISVVALLVSGLAVVYATRTDERDVFLRLHETLISPELQRGRKVLFDLYRRAGAVEDLGSLEHRDGMFPGIPVRPRYKRLASRAEARLIASGVDASVLSDRSL